jgi:signal transduction histidine kinase
MEKLLVVTDRARLSDILKCLLSNAVKFTKEGHISVGYSLKYNGVELFVEDTGCGIHDEDKDRIFGRFEKADDFSVGTGLGLAICKELSSLMGGHISVVSQWGKGSTFLVWLPLNGM